MDENSVHPVQGPDCLNCWRRNICPQMEEGKFCGKWQSKEPSPHPTRCAGHLPLKGKALETVNDYDEHRFSGLLSEE